MADILTTISQSDNFSLLVSAINKAGLADTLRGAGPFTLFAPTDDAFNALPSGTLTALMDNPEQLRNLLLFHVLPGRITSDEIKAQEIRSARTIQGDALAIDTNLLGQVKVETATVTRADVLADNGIIHIISAVLLPDTLRGRMAA